MAGQQALHARYIVPVLPQGSVLEHYSLIILGSKILELLPSADARDRYPDATHVELPHHVLLPGLINMHTHSPMVLMRGLADDMSLQTWLQDHIWPEERKWVSEAFVDDGVKLAMAEMLRAGTTCFNENYFFPDVMTAASKQAGMRSCMGLPVIELATAWAAGSEECLLKAEALMEQFEDDDLVSFALAPHAPYTVSDESLKRVQAISALHSLPVHMHVLESGWEIKQSLQAHGERPLERLLRLKLLNRQLLAVHMTQLTAKDIALLAHQGVNVVHCPQSNLKLANGVCSVSDLVGAGVNICLGTDGAAANNNLDLLSEAQTAALLAKGISGRAETVPAVQALEMMTINAAQALGQQHRIGSLEPGKEADVVALDLQQPETQPIYNVISQLIYAASGRQFTDVWVAGRQLMKHGGLTTLDLNRLIDAAQQWQRKIAGGRVDSKRYN